jgi:hypothetical protein
MSKYKKIVISTLITLVIIVLIINVSRYVIKRNINPKDYVLNNYVEMNEIAKKILLNSDNDGKIMNYRSQNDLMARTDVTRLYSNLAIYMISVRRDMDNYPDSVKIYLNNEPVDDDYYQCGIFYTMDDCGIDVFGKKVEEDEYIYDGRPNNERIMYKYEKICPNWYYFEEAIW